jgi:serine/threonine protein kinase
MDCIASGCFAQIFLSKKKNIIYATKRISVNDINTEPYLKNYLDNEINFLKEVNHKNIIKLYDVKVDYEYIYLVMEYCNGGTLLNALNDYKAKNGKPFTEGITQYFMRQILSGVEALHSHGIIHNDLKLDNILLKYNTNNRNLLSSEIKIIDFNISTRSRNYINNKMPEKKSSLPIMFNDDEGDDIYDEKVDIWSLGLLCYEMLFGEKLLSQNNNIYSKKTINISIPQSISLKAQTFLLSMLQKNGNKRLSATELLNHEFIKDSNTDKVSCSYIDKTNLLFTPDIKTKSVSFFGQRQTYSNQNDSIKMNSLFDIKNIPLFNNETKYKSFIDYNQDNKYKTPNKTIKKAQIICKVFSKGHNLDKNQVKTIVNCCINSYKQMKTKKNASIKAANEIKRKLGNDWIVIISDLEGKTLDFYLSCTNKDNLVSFSYENLLFQICRYY